MTLENLVSDVLDWHLAHFGAAAIDEPLALKLLKEAGEFYRTVMADQLVTGNVEDAAEEAADVLIVLCAWAGRNDVDLLEVARIKLAIVNNRDQIERDVERGILPVGFVAK